MITILYTIFTDEIDEVRFNEYLKLLPSSIQKSINEYKRKEDGYSCLLGKLLLMEGLKKFGSSDLSLQDMQYSKFSKPYFLDVFNFNISHSGKMVVCAFDVDNEIGIDTEEIIPIDLEDFNSQFTQRERLEIKENQDPVKAFYQWWTKKESVVKADGRGLNIPLKSIVFENDDEAYIEDRKWYLKSVDLHGDYCVHMACSKPFDAEIESQQYYF